MLSLLSCGIGHGHPFYLDGVANELDGMGRGGVVARRATVFDVCNGPSLLAWKAVRSLYRSAGTSQRVAELLGKLRQRAPSRTAFLTGLLGRELRRWCDPDGIVFVDHPFLVATLHGFEDVWYMHGELIAPEASLVSGAKRVFVPTEEVARRFQDRGYPASRLVITGLCVDPRLVPFSARATEERQRRLASKGPLTLGFFSSGAEPAAHVRALVDGAISTARSPHRSIAFVQRGGRFERALRQGLGAPPDGGVRIVKFSSRDELGSETARYFSELDVVVSPPHERSHWALGLGLPFLLVGPDVGPFAPLNRSLLLRAGVAAELARDQAPRLGEQLKELHASGALLRMSEAGVGPSVTGFQRAAEWVIQELGRTAAGGDRPRGSG